MAVTGAKVAPGGCEGAGSAQALPLIEGESHVLAVLGLGLPIEPGQQHGGRLGYASAVSWLLFVMVFVVTMFNWKFGNRYTNE